MAKKMPAFLEALQNAGANPKKSGKKNVSKKKPPVKKGK